MVDETILLLVAVFGSQKRADHIAARVSDIFLPCSSRTRSVSAARAGLLRVTDAVRSRH